MHCTKSHCLPWIYFFASGQAYIALSRVRTLADLVLWDFDPSVIQLDPFYQQLCQWMDCVDVINPNLPLYTGRTSLRICNDDVNAQFLIIKMMMELILSQFSLHALSKFLLQVHVLRNSLSVVEDHHTNQSLLIQVTNLSMVEDDHPSVKILPQIAVLLNQRSIR